VGDLREAVESTHVGRDRGEAGGGIDGEEPLERLRVPRFVGTPEGVDDVEGLGGRRQRLAGGLGLGKRRRRRGRAAPLPRRRAREERFHAALTCCSVTARAPALKAISRLASAITLTSRGTPRVSRATVVTAPGVKSSRRAPARASWSWM